VFRDAGRRDVGICDRVRGGGSTAPVDHAAEADFARY
jgi:hypothetical protein